MLATKKPRRKLASIVKRDYGKTIAFQPGTHIGSMKWQRITTQKILQLNDREIHKSEYLSNGRKQHYKYSIVAAGKEQANILARRFGNSISIFEIRSFNRQEGAKNLIALFRTVQEECRQRRIKKIKTRVLPDLVRILKRYGFKQTGKQKYYLGKPDAVLMELEIV